MNRKQCKVKINVLIEVFDQTVVILTELYST